MTAVIEVSSLKKDFSGRRVIDDITFSVEKGEVFGYLGPNGAGKTTTMRILLGLLAPSSGKARVLSSDLAVNDRARGKVGVLMENNGLYERLTARENLDYFARLYDIEQPRDRVAELLEFTGLEERSGEPIGNFSTGMKRKLGIARTILHEPEIVFFDEPTSGLDPEAQHMVRELILDLSKREAMTVFLNSHNLDEVQKICSRVAILHRGKIRVLDSIRNLAEKGQKSMYIVTLADPGLGTAALDLLSTVGGISDLSLGQNRITMRLDGIPAHDVIAMLVEGGIAIDEAWREGRSLEDIYLGVMQQAEGSVS